MKETLFLDKSFSIKVLTLLKRRIIAHLDYSQMLEIANPDELKILASFDYTCSLSADSIEKLQEKCTTRELKNMLLNQRSI